MRALAQRLRAPVVPTQMALGVVPSDSPHFIGHGGLIAGDAVRAAFAEADVILAVGCRFSSWMWDERGPFARRHHRSININIDPSALGHPALHEVAMQADARLALDDLLAALGAAPTAAVDADWLPGLRGTAPALRGKLVEMANEADRRHASRGARRGDRRCAAADALAVYDGGHTTFWSNDLTPVHEPCAPASTIPGMTPSRLRPALCARAAAAASEAAGGQHHRRRLVRLHPQRTRHRAALPAAGRHASSTTTPPGASSAPASARNSISSSAPASRAPTTRRSPAASAATARS